MVSFTRARVLPPCYRVYAFLLVICLFYIALFLDGQAESFSTRSFDCPLRPLLPAPLDHRRPFCGSLAQLTRPSLPSVAGAVGSPQMEMGNGKREENSSSFLQFCRRWLRGRRSSRGGKAAEETRDPLERPDELMEKQEEVKPLRKWDYKQQGADWAPVLACGLSCKRQSPIEIDPEAIQRLLSRCMKGEVSAEETTSTGNIAKLATPGLLLCNKLAAAAQIEKELVVFDCGYKLQMKPPHDGAFGQLKTGAGHGKETYQVVQFHFHAPAEHTFGSRGSIELHIVCQCLTEGRKDRLLVLAIVFDKSTGDSESSFLKACESALIYSLSEEAKTHLPEWVGVALQEAAKEIHEPAESLDLKSLLSDDCTLIVYEGSLTTPPCTENVTWYVVRDPLPVSADQAKRFSCYLQSGEGDELHGNYRLRQNVEVKANEQILHVLAAGLPPKLTKGQEPQADEEDGKAESALNAGKSQAHEANRVTANAPRSGTDITASKSE